MADVQAFCRSHMPGAHVLTMSCCMCAGANIEAVTSRAVLVDEIENQVGLMFNMATPSIHRAEPGRAAFCA